MNAREVYERVFEQNRQLRLAAGEDERIAAWDSCIYALAKALGTAGVEVRGEDVYSMCGSYLEADAGYTYNLAQLARALSGKIERFNEMGSDGEPSRVYIGKPRADTIVALDTVVGEQEHATSCARERNDYKLATLWQFTAWRDAVLALMAEAGLEVSIAEVTRTAADYADADAANEARLAELREWRAGWAGRQTVVARMPARVDLEREWGEDATPAGDFATNRYIVFRRGALTADGRKITAAAEDVSGERLLLRCESVTRGWEQMVASARERDAELVGYWESGRGWMAAYRSDAHLVLIPAEQDVLVRRAVKPDAVRLTSAAVVFYRSGEPVAAVSVCRLNQFAGKSEMFERLLTMEVCDDRPAV